MNWSDFLRTRSAARFGLWLTLAAISLLAIRAAKLRHDYLTRGLTIGLPEPIDGGSAQLGINVALEQYDEPALAENLAEIRALGIRYVKQSFYYSEAMDWGAAQRIVAAVSQQELTLVALLDGDPNNGFAPPDDPSSFAAWAAEFAARFGSELSHYIIWDEPNLASHWGDRPPNPAEYAALLTSAAQAIRSADADAVIVCAPLAPTIETGPLNLSDPQFLQQLYDSGAAAAFDLVAAKPYGFDNGAEDRTVKPSALNFSRAILLREVMERNGDAHKAIWAGNWGWNSLPQPWSGAPSIWGQTTASQQAVWTVAALERAQQEWPWMGVMFLENWQPSAQGNDPLWGFSIKGRETAEAIGNRLMSLEPDVAMPGFHVAQPTDPSQVYDGDWRFSPEYGADIGATGDRVTFTFWGTDVGLRVRRANFRARFYVTVDGEPANALPSDENGTMLILTSAEPGEDYLSTEWIARGLEAGVHQVQLVASRGWDQWALSGFSAGYQPADSDYRWSLAGFLALFIISSWLTFREVRAIDWSASGKRLSGAFLRLGKLAQLAITAVAAVLVALTGWLTWGEQAAGMYRRLGDGTQIALTAAAASFFYVTPSFFVFAAALVVLFLLIMFRPAWGVALIAFCFPLYVLPKPILNYRFSPVELFTLVTVGATLMSKTISSRALFQSGPLRPALSGLRRRFHPADYAVLFFLLVATVSLLFTKRVDVATNEWRAVILEPVLLYLLLRLVIKRDGEMWIVLDSFVIGGLLVALYGLWQFGSGQGLITAEGGLMRLRSFYGSPNNVALYLGRVLPMLAAVALLGGHVNKARRAAYSLMIVPVGLAILLSFSKGGLFLGLPAAALFILWRWLRFKGRRAWPWLLLLLGIGAVTIVAVGQVPRLAGRMDLAGDTGVFRVNLWRSSLNMIADHPLFGVGLDNFLYAYRGRYIFDAAWQEPNLSHPHNLVLDFATRLGIFGLLAGCWLLWALVRALRGLRGLKPREWLPVTVGLGGAFADMVAHGMVDHGLFLVDLSFAFFLLLGMAVWLQLREQA